MTCFISAPHSNLSHGTTPSEGSDSVVVNSSPSLSKLIALSQSALLSDSNLVSTSASTDGQAILTKFQETDCFNPFLKVRERATNQDNDH
jgi:hypothetical protein